MEFDVAMSSAGADHESVPSNLQHTMSHINILYCVPYMSAEVRIPLDLRRKCSIAQLDDIESVSRAACIYQ